MRAARHGRFTAATGVTLLQSSQEPQPVAAVSVQTYLNLVNCVVLSLAALYSIRVWSAERTSGVLAPRD